VITSEIPLTDVQFGATGGTYLFPLHGLEAFADDFELCGARILRPSVYTWAYIEKGTVGDFIVKNADRVPLFAVFTRSDVTDLPDAANRFAEVDGVFRQALMALRLLRGGGLIDPTLSARYFVIGAYTSRHSALYRQTFVKHHFPDPYRLEAEDLPRLIHLNTLVRRAAEAQWGEVDLILENLNHRFALHLGDPDRYAMLCTSLEVVFGRFGDTIQGASLAARASAACSLAPSWLGDRFDESAFLAGPARDLRNIVMHGGDLEATLPLQESVDRLTTIVRRAVVVYLALRPQHRDKSTPVRWFNTVLAGVVAGDPSTQLLAQRAIREAQLHEAAS
jgi:hypothetical protein